MCYPKFWAKFNIFTLLLIPFSWIYIFLGYLRRVFVAPVKLPGKVICIGNITVGGTGKTQLVKWLISEFEKNSKKFVIITKAYRSTLKGAVLVEPYHTPSEVGDESLLLRKYCKVIAAKNIKDSISIIEKLDVEYIIVDDGLQNPHFYKDYKFLTIDANRLNGNGFIFPAGPLRQKLSDIITQIDFIVMIGDSYSFDYNNFVDNIRRFGKKLYRAGTKLSSEINSSTKYIAFSGIGNPDKFFNLLRGNNVNLLDAVSFPDHHDYSVSDIEKLISKAKVNDCELITTEKDYVKITPEMKKMYKIHCALVNLSIINGEEIINFINTSYV